MVKERKKNEGVAVKRRVWVGRNCNVFNLAMENVLKGLNYLTKSEISCPDIILCSDSYTNAFQIK
jgi:hypothetical protein